MFPGLRTSSRCLVFLPSYLISYPAICLIDVIYLNCWGRQRCSPWHTHPNVSTQKRGHVSTTTAHRRPYSISTSDILFRLFHVFWKSEDIIHPLSRLLSQRGHCEVTASIILLNHHISSADECLRTGILIKSLNFARISLFYFKHMQDCATLFLRSLNEQLILY